MLKKADDKITEFVDSLPKLPPWAFIVMFVALEFFLIILG
jgi:hypothetical protein